MKLAIIGAGPAGLYLAYLLKRARPETPIEVFEQNPPHATFGFGVVFSERALEFLREEDEETYAAVMPEMESWSDMTLDVQGEVVCIDGIGFSAIGRLRLLALLEARARSVGIRVRYGHSVRALDELAGADLIVGADGVHSIVRHAHERALGSRVDTLTNKFAWYGTTKRFETLTQTFRRAAFGPINAHHYRYSPEMSTFLVETDASSWQRAGFETMDPQDTRACLEAVFADVLQGHPLVSNQSVWRSFPVVRNERFSAGNAVLLGDALHTAHFSIGSGTRLAMEDAIALAHALEAPAQDPLAALQAYEATRRPILEKLVVAAEASAAWYERFGEHMELPPYELAMSYITRSGRVDVDRLRRTSPRFMEEYDRHRARRA